MAEKVRIIKFSNPTSCMINGPCNITLVTTPRQKFNRDVNQVNINIIPSKFNSCIDSPIPAPTNQDTETPPE